MDFRPSFLPSRPYFRVCVSVAVFQSTETSLYWILNLILALCAAKSWGPVRSVHSMFKTRPCLGGCRPPDPLPHPGGPPPRPLASFLGAPHPGLPQRRIRMTSAICTEHDPYRTHGSFKCRRSQVNIRPRRDLKGSYNGNMIFWRSNLFDVFQTVLVNC